MKVVKYILITLAIIILILVAYGYMQDRNVTVERSEVIKAPISLVFNQVNDLENRVQWSPWEKDTTMNTTLGDITKGLGANYSWSSENSGSGRLEYVEVEKNQKIVSAIDFQEQGKAEGIFTFDEVEDGVKVTWTMNSDMGNNPLSRIFGRFMDAMVGPQFEKGLADLKERCENMPARESAITMGETYEVIEIVENTDESAVQIREVKTFAMPFISIKDSCSVSEMDSRMMKSVNSLKKYIAKNDLSTAGAPITFYHVWNPPATVVYEPAMRLNEVAEGKDEFNSGITHSGKAVMAIHVGSYESMEESWNALDAYVQSKGYNVIGSPWEEYIRYSDNEPVAENYLTHIYMPVSE